MSVRDPDKDAPAGAAMKYTTHAAEETVALGRKLAPALKRGSMVLLRGDLGAGKTTLVKGIAEGFQAAEADRVTSPTFTLIHEYRAPRLLSTTSTSTASIPSANSIPLRSTT